MKSSPFSICRYQTLIKTTKKEVTTRTAYTLIFFRTEKDDSREDPVEDLLKLILIQKPELEIYDATTALPYQTYKTKKALPQRYKLQK